VKRARKGGPAPPSTHSVSSSAWELSAPESYLLLHGLEASPAEVLKTAFRELVARGVFKISEIELRTSGGVQRRYVVDSPARKRQVRRPLYELVEIYDAMPARRIDPVKAPPVSLADYVGEVLRRFKGIEGYRELVLSALVDRGLYKHERYRRMGLLSGERDVPTTAGTQARDELDRRLKTAGDMPEWLRGVALAGLLGSAVLLVDDAYPELERLRERLGAALTAPVQPEAPLPESFQLLGIPANAGAGSASPGRTTPGTSGAATARTGVDLGALAFDLDFASLANMDAALKAIDAVIESPARG
jgi:hypothetical protein